LRLVKILPAKLAAVLILQGLEYGAAGLLTLAKELRPGHHFEGVHEAEKGAPGNGARVVEGFGGRKEM